MIATLLIIKNPLKLYEVDKKIIQIPFNGITVEKLLKNYAFCEWEVAVNDRIVDNDYVIKPNDIIAISPKIEKGSLGSILKIVLVIVVTYFCSVCGAAWLKAGIMVAGSMLIDAVLPPPTPDIPNIGNDGWNESPTYSWNQLQPTRGQGYTIPILYGKMKVSGQELVKDITVNGNKQYLHLMMGICGHEIDSITDIRVNDQPVSYYRNITTYTRMGTNNDEFIPGFGRIPTMNNVNIRLTPTYNEQETQGNLVNRITLDFIMNQGLFRMDERGDIQSYSVSINIQYKKHSASTWTTINRTYTGSSTEPIRKTVSIDNLTSDKYDVRIRRTSSESSNVRIKDAIKWSIITEYVNEKIRYNNIAKYAIRALATDQLSGEQPVLSCIANRSTVRIYNPNIHGWETKSATNPAWAAYHLLTIVHEIDYNLVDFDAFSSFADYCDEEIDGKPRHTCNLYLDTTTNLWRNLLAILQLGRAAPVKFGSVYSLIVNKPSIPVHLFDQSNMLENSFSISYISSADKANAVEITYIDEERDFTRQVIGAYSVDYNKPDTPNNKTSMRLFGCTNQTEVLREAAFRLNSTKWLTRQVKFKSNINSVPCRVGQLAYIQHDAPDWSIGGRIVSATSNTITFDKPISVETGKNYLTIIQLEDDTLVEKEIINPGTGEYITFTVTSSFVTQPKQYNHYMFGESSEIKRIYRISKIDRISDLTVEIFATEYNEEIYTDSEYVFELPEWDEKIQNAINVEADEIVMVRNDGSYTSKVNLSWTPTFIANGYNWSVWLQDITPGIDETDPILIGHSTTLSYIIPSDRVSLDCTYKVYISRYNQGAVDNGSNTTIFKITSEFEKPGNISTFTGVFNPKTRSVVFNWSALEEINLDHYEIREGGSDWNTATTIIGNVKDTTVSYYIEDSIVNENRTYRIKGVNRAEQESENCTNTTVLIDTSKTTLMEPTGLTLNSSSEIQNDGTEIVIINVSWDDNAEASDDFNYYEIEIENPSTSWKKREQTSNNVYSFIVSANTTYNTKIRAVDKKGNKTQWVTGSVLSSKDSTKPNNVTFNDSDSGINPGFKVISLHWDKVSDKDLKYYLVQRADNSSFSTNVKDFHISANYFTDSGLQVNKTYYYRIRAVDTSDNESLNWSETKSTTTTRVGHADLTANSVYSNNIYTGDTYTMTIQSSNYDSNHGWKIDQNGDATFNNGSITLNYTDVSGLGDLATQDGVSYNQVTGSKPPINADNTTAAIDNGVDTDTGGIIVRNSGNGDYAHLTDGDLDFYRNINGTIRHFKSVKRIDYNNTPVANESTVTLNGYWTSIPAINITPRSCKFYLHGYSNQDQTLQCYVTDQKISSSGIVTFKPIIRNVIDAGSSNNIYNSANTTNIRSSSPNWDCNSPPILCSGTGSTITQNVASCDSVEAYFNLTGGYSNRPVFQCYCCYGRRWDVRAARFIMHLSIYCGGWYNNVASRAVTQNGTYSLSANKRTNKITQIRITFSIDNYKGSVLTHYLCQEGEYGCVSPTDCANTSYDSYFKLTNAVSRFDSANVLATGTCDYIAIGE